MNPWIIALVVAVGSATGLYIDYPGAKIEGLVVFGLVNSVFALVLSAVILSALRLLGEPPTRRR